MKYILTILFLAFFIIGCKPQEVLLIKENIPTVTTKEAADFTNYGATMNGEVTDEGFTATTDRGFVYSDKNPNPSVSDKKVQSGYGKGIYFVKLEKLALNTKYYFRAYATNTKGTAYGVVQSFTTPVHPRDETTKVIEFKSPRTGRIWMDRNLGATQAATSSNDPGSYGDLYQWGRPADGHQIRTSSVTRDVSNSDQPPHDKFILNTGINDWRSPKNDNLWQGVNGINNPCPNGYRLPTLKEWEAESFLNLKQYISIPLLPLAGYRSSGSSVTFFYESGERGRYYTSNEGISISVLPGNTYSGWGSGNRSNAMSVRCIKD